MSRLTSPKMKAQTAKPRNPAQSSLRLSMREPRDADDGRADEGADAAGKDDQAGGEGRVAENLLIVERQDGDGDVDAHAEHGNHQAAGAEVAVLEDVQVDQALGVGPGAPDPQQERDDERRHGPAHPDGAEPVVLLALVEHDLQAAGPDDRASRSRCCRRRPPWRS